MNDPTHVDYIPSLFVFTPSPQKRCLLKRAQRHEHVSELKQKRLKRNEVLVSSAETLTLQQASEDTMHMQTSDSQDVDSTELHNDTEEDEQFAVKDVVTKLQSELKNTQQKLKVAEDQTEEIKKELEERKKTDLTMDSLKDNPRAVHFYTGLPSFGVLMMIFNLAQKTLPSVRTHGNRKLSNFSEFLITLVKLRLNLRNKDLGFRFGVSETLISLTVHKWINILYVALNFLIRWPSKEEVRATLPECFRTKFSKAIAIIDCTEIFIERPSNLLARCQTWSNYKCHNTIKYLIGITPQGTISFVSKAWGGRVSDKVLTEECGILNKLLPGDLLLADRGFNIFELVATYNAQVKLPAFTKGKSQLSAKEIHESRELAHVRIHVERLIGMVKQKYSILDGVLPISFIKNDSTCNLTVADKVMVICCALVNVCEPIVPKD